MAFVLTQSAAIPPGPAAGIAAPLRRLRVLCNLTSQQRLDRYMARLPIAVVAG